MDTVIPPRRAVCNCPPLPSQGLEIVNPQAAEKKVSEDSARYFSAVAAFAKKERS